MDLDLTGRQAFITGSTRGIGFATAICLARMGASVTLHGRQRGSLENALEMISNVVPEAAVQGIAADLADETDYQRIFETMIDIDILINNLGIYQQRPFWEVPDQEWLHFFNANVMSWVRLTRHYLPGMLARNWGRIVNVSSESGAAIPKEMIHYGVLKATQLAFSRAVAELTADTGVTVNSVLPGPTMVETTAEQLQQKADARQVSFEIIGRETFDVRKPTSLLRRYTTAEEVANMICYLCSPAASATNGAPMRVDGGIVQSFV